MEERVSSLPPNEDLKKDEEPPLPLPPAKRTPETYLIQLPKDQIYRIPPPENALIVERYLNPVNTKKSHWSRLKWIILVVVIILIIAGISSLIVYFTHKPSDPTFSIDNVIVKNLTSRHNYKLEFDIKVKTDNPNDGTSIEYRGGSAALSYRNKIIAKINTTFLKLDSKSSKVFRLKLTGSNIVLPREVAKGMKGKQPNCESRYPPLVGVPFSLSIRLPTEIAKGALQTWSRDMDITCKFKVNSLGKGTCILSQECHIKKS